MKFPDEFTLFELEFDLEHYTESSAIYSIVGNVDMALEHIGSLDVHVNAQEDNYFCTSVVIDDGYDLRLSNNELRELLMKEFDVSVDALWRQRFWRSSAGQVGDNNPRAFRRI